MTFHSHAQCAAERWGRGQGATDRHVAKKFGGDFQHFQLPGLALPPFLHERSHVLKSLALSDSRPWHSGL